MNTRSMDLLGVRRSKKRIKIGRRHQAVIPTCQGPMEFPAATRRPKIEECLWNPNKLPEESVILYLKEVNNYKEPNGAPDDVVPDDEEALHILKKLNYDVSRALRFIRNQGKTKYRRANNNWTEDDMESFLTGYKTYQKDFGSIKTQCLPHKTLTEVINYYYKWKLSPEAKNCMINLRRWFKEETPVQEES